MVWLIFGSILFFTTFFILGIDYKAVKHCSEFKWKINKRQLFSLIFLLVCAISFIAKVPANSVGIVYSPFGGTKEQTLNEGYSIKNPFDKIYKITTEVQTSSVEGLTTQTKDAQYVTSTLDVKYRVNPSDAFLVFKQYRTLKNMSENLIVPTTQRVLELVTTKYNVIDILGAQRSEIYSELEAALSNEFKKYGVEFYSISLTDMDAGEKLENAITEEAVAKKAVETAEQNLLKSQTEAKQKSVLAQAEQDAAKIRAETKLIEAEAEKQANDMLKQSLSDEILRKEWIDRWDGVMPKFYSGDSSNSMGIILDPEM